MAQTPKGRLVKGPRFNQYVDNLCHLLSITVFEKKYQPSQLNGMDTD